MVRWQGELPRVEDLEVLEVEAVPVEVEEKPSTDYYRKWLVIFLTTALFWAVIFTAAWLNHIISG